MLASAPEQAPSVGTGDKPKGPVLPLQPQNCTVHLQEVTCLAPSGSTAPGHTTGVAFSVFHRGGGT